MLLRCGLDPVPRLILLLVGHALDLVDDGDYAPTAQDSQEFVQLKGEADRQLAAWSALKRGEVAALERSR